MLEEGSVGVKLNGGLPDSGCLHPDERGMMNHERGGGPCIDSPSKALQLRWAKANGEVTMSGVTNIDKNMNYVSEYGVDMSPKMGPCLLSMIKNT